MTIKKKSSITLPPEELALVKKLRSELKAKSNVEVIRRSLKLLSEVLSRDHLRQRFADAAKAVAEEDLTDLDKLSSEGLD